MPLKSGIVIFTMEKEGRTTKKDHRNDAFGRSYPPWLCLFLPSEWKNLPHWAVAVDKFRRTELLPAGKKYIFYELHKTIRSAQVTPAGSAFSARYSAPASARRTVRVK